MRAPASADMGRGSWYLSPIRTTESLVGNGLVAKPRDSFSGAWSLP